MVRRSVPVHVVRPATITVLAERGAARVRGNGSGMSSGVMAERTVAGHVPTLGPAAGRLRSRHDRGETDKGGRSIRSRRTGDARNRPQTRTLGPWDFTEMGSGGIAPGSSWSSSRWGSSSGCCPPAVGDPRAAGCECVPDRRRVCRRSRASPAHPQRWHNRGPVPRTPGYPLVGWQIRQGSTTSAIGRGRSGPSM
jgi:hypothetical protein